MVRDYLRYNQNKLQLQSDKNKWVTKALLLLTNQLFLLLIQGITKTTFLSALILADLLNF